MRYVLPGLHLLRLGRPLPACLVMVLFFGSGWGLHHHYSGKKPIGLALSYADIFMGSVTPSPEQHYTLMVTDKSQSLRKVSPILPGEGTISYPPLRILILGYHVVFILILLLNTLHLMAERRDRDAAP